VADAVDPLGPRPPGAAGAAAAGTLGRASSDPASSATSSFENRDIRDITYDNPLRNGAEEPLHGYRRLSLAADDYTPSPIDDISSDRLILVTDRVVRRQVPIRRSPALPPSPHGPTERAGHDSTD
jgi:hypothetical protein